MNSPPLGPKPKHLLPLPAYLINGTSPLHKSSEANHKKERDSLYSSIKSSSTRREPVDLDGPNGYFPRHRISRADGASHPQHEGSAAPDHVHEVKARDPRDEPLPPTPSSSRPSSPITQMPPLDFDGLSWPSVGTRARLEATPEEAQARLEKMAGAVRTILECMGEDPDREGVLDTPMRYAKAMMFFTKGYEVNLRDIVNGAVFYEDHDELVIVKDIEVFSLCEHHMVPFTGKMHIGYIPNGRVIGLSKLARIAEMYSRRLQVQERLTKQVALALLEVLRPRGVGVVMEACHMCMTMRGVQKTTSTTVTSCMLGCMRTMAKTREEFLNLLKR